MNLSDDLSYDSNVSLLSTDIDMDLAGTRKFPIKEPIESKNPIQYILSRIVPAIAVKYPEKISEDLKKTIRKICNCRTEFIGGTVFGCIEHKFAHIMPFSCGCRFCPVCSNFKTQKWLDAAVELLSSIDTQYFFLTFTVPSPISQIIKLNKDLLEDFFHSTSLSLLGWCNGRNFLPGIVMIMQTSGDKLNFHVHIHLLITAGGLSLKDFSTWAKCDHFSRKAISEAFKTLIFRALRRTFNSGDFVSPPEYKESACSSPEKFNKFLDELYKLNWNLDIKPALKDSENILGYIARYIKKPPISNKRITEFDNSFVTAIYKEYTKLNKGEKQKGTKFTKTRQTIPMEQFILDLLEHFPEKNFKVVRWYGLFSNRNKNRLLKRCPEKIKKETKVAEKPKEIDNRPYWRKRHEKLHGIDPLICPICKKEMVPLMILTKKRIKQYNDKYCTFQEVLGYLGYQFLNRN